MEERNIIENKLYNSKNDPIINLLIKKSNLTKTQFETFIIDVLIDSMSDNKVTYNEKTIFRNQKVTRGAFSRTLSQARKRIISSVYTMILLSYIGVFENQPFNEYEILAEKLREYLSLINSSGGKQSRELLKRIETELNMGIENLSKPKNLKVM